MAFDYGSIDLGLKNPFKKEGAVTAIRGGIQTLVALVVLFIAAGKVKTDPISGWVFVVIGSAILFSGIRAASVGIFALLRFFVGRNHPTSLAYNYSKSESSTASAEENEVAYTAPILEEMLMGRKNPTFLEPNGFLARILHTLLPKLLYMPYPIRNRAQSLFGAWVGTLAALLSYAIAAFICLNGFAGNAGEKLFPVYSVAILIYVLIVWYAASFGALRNAQKSVPSLGGKNIAKIVVLSIVMPLVVGLGISMFLALFNQYAGQNIDNAAEVMTFLLEGTPDFSPFLYIASIIVLAILCSIATILMLRQRSLRANPITEVSELRENWQESVHPNEVFINLDNLVMANRRYKEVPNRVYRELKPRLNEQVDSKGSFYGEMIQEVQPTVHDMKLGKQFTLIRSLSLYASNVLHLIVTALTLWLAYSLVDAVNFLGSESALLVENFNTLKTMNEDSLSSIQEYITNFFTLGMPIIHLLLARFIVKIFANFLGNTAHLFFAEMQFESLLVYFKCEGTFTESKISTGTSIHDSTRSENILVRSSITPWVIVTKVVSSTFAASGMKNLEYPRHILEMHKSETDMADLRKDVINFLKDRESIASITSARDLENTSKIHAINAQSRANITSDKKLLTQEEEAAGYLRENENNNFDKA